MWVGGGQEKGGVSGEDIEKLAWGYCGGETHGEKHTLTRALMR